jgi:predicted AAA+ superfamily ATPase
MLFKRVLNLPDMLSKKSYFLFGPRATGKSTLIREQFSRDTPIIDLLEHELYLRLSTNPDGFVA